VLPALIAQLPEGRQRLGLRPVQMAGHRGLTFRQYVALEAGESCTSTTTSTNGSSRCADGRGTTWRRQTDRRWRRARATSDRQPSPGSGQRAGSGSPATRVPSIDVFVKPVTCKPGDPRWFDRVLARLASCRSSAGCASCCPEVSCVRCLVSSARRTTARQSLTPQGYRSAGRR